MVTDEGKLLVVSACKLVEPSVQGIKAVDDCIEPLTNFTFHGQIVITPVPDALLLLDAKLKVHVPDGKVESRVLPEIKPLPFGPSGFAWELRVLFTPG